MSGRADELLPWLRAQLDEDERAARACPPWPWRLNDEGDEVWAADDVEVAAVFALSGSQTRATAAHIARWDPARVLAEVAAKRAVINAYAEVAEWYGRPSNRPAPAGEVFGLWTAVQHLGVAYSTRHGYRDEWRP